MPLLATAAFVLLSSSAPQADPVCDTFSDAEVADLLGRPPLLKRPMFGPGTDCLWSIPGFMLNVTRTIDNNPQVVKGVVDSRAKKADRDVVTAERGIGDQALSVQDRYGRSVTLAFRSGHSAWIMNLEKVDEKVDAANALPKLRALAKKAAGTRK